MIFVDEASREGKAASLKATECYEEWVICHTFETLKCISSTHYGRNRMAFELWQKNRMAGVQGADFE